jgi:cytochrome oxidase Cu insertion factor (SCO1/SenC/PrrC family)
LKLASDEFSGVELAKRRRNRFMLVGLFALTVVPLLVAYLLYENARTGDRWATTNRGQLLEPIVSINTFDVVAVDPGASMDGSGSWWIAVVSEGACEAACLNALHQVRQLHVLLGRDADRVKRALVVLGADAPVDALSSEYPRLAWFTGAADVLPGGVYIIDPLGNVVLRYPYADAGKPILEDMKKLLKVSHIG